MDNWIEKFDQILNDPESMKQIIDTVSALGIQSPASDILPNTPEFARQVTDVLHIAQEKEQKHQALIHALLPYLRPGKQRRLERAMQVAQITHLAGLALQGRNAPKPEEDAHV